MSMFRQLWLAILASTLMALTGSLLVSMLSARSYLESQLSGPAQLKRMRLCRRNDAAAQAYLTVIEHCRLPWGDGPLRF